MTVSAPLIDGAPGDMASLDRVLAIARPTAERSQWRRTEARTRDDASLPELLGIAGVSDSPSPFWPVLSPF